MPRISAREAATRIGISTSMLYQLCSERRLPHIRLGGTDRRGKILVEEADIDAFLAAARVEAAPAGGTAQPPLKHITRK